MNLGTLTIEMAANVARLRQDMDAARKTVESAVGGIQRAAGVAAGALGAIGVGLSVSAFGGWIKSAIDAADETSKLAQKIGVTTDQVAGLQLAFSQSGLAAADVNGAMARLARGIAEGSDALKAMRIETRNADGSLKGTRETLGVVADKFASYSDGAGKAALAMELFGKSGTDLIPLLNGGSAALDEFDRTAASLGLTVDEKTAKAAENFNDTLELIGLSSQGVARRVAADLLPTLSGLAGEFFRSLTEGDKLKNVANGLSIALRGLYVGGVAVVQVFSTVAEVLSGVSSAIYLAVRGEFREAGIALDLMKKNISTGWSDALAAMARAWNTTGDAGVEATARVVGALKGAAPIVVAGKDNVDKFAESFAKLRDKINGKESGTDSDFIANLNLLAEAYKRRLIPSLEEYLRLADAYVRTQPYMTEQTKRQIEDAQKLAEVRAKALYDEDAARMDALKSIDDEIAAQRRANEEIGLTAEQLAELKIRRQEDALAILEQTLANRQKAGADAIEIDGLQQQIDRTRELIGLRKDGAGAEAQVAAAKRTADEWKKTADQIEQGLTDSLFRAAESGKGFFESLLSSLKGMFNNLVLRPIIQASIAGIAGGGAGSAVAGTAGGGALTGAGAGLGLGAAVSGFASWVGTGISGTMAGASLSSALGASGALMSGGSMAGGAGLAIGAIAPYAIAGYALYSIGRSLTRRRVTASGIEGTLGGEAGFSGNQFTEFRRRIGGSGRNTSELDPAFSSDVERAVEQVRTEVSAYAQALGLPVDALRAYTRALRIDTRGLSEAQIAEKVQEALRGFADGLAGTFGAELTQFVREGETASETVARLGGSLGAANTTLKALGQTLLQVSAAGGDAASRLIEEFGSADNFASASGAYLQAFYTDAERVALSTREVQDTLAAVGIALPSTRAEYRRLVEAQDLMTDAGRTAYATLLRVAPLYAQAADAAESAAQAAYDAQVQLEIERVEAINDANRAAVDAAQDVRNAWRGVGDTILEEVRRLRGEIEAAPLANFATLTAQARAGDMGAAELLPEAARAAIDAARGSAGSAAEFNRQRAMIAASLAETGLYATGRANEPLPVFEQVTPTLSGLPAPVPAVVSPVVPQAGTINADNAASTALRQELEAMRAELRAANAAIAANTAETARTLSRWDGDSLPPAYADPA